MLKRTLQFVVAFHTTAEAMETERMCKSLGLPGRLIPAPRSVTADCGIAWCSPLHIKDELRKALEEEQIEYAGAFELEI